MNSVRIQPGELICKSLILLVRAFLGKIAKPFKIRFESYVGLILAPAICSRGSAWQLPTTPFSVNFPCDLRLSAEAKVSTHAEHGLCSRVTVAPRGTQMENGSATGRAAMAVKCEDLCTFEEL